MDSGATWYGGRPRPVLPPPKGAHQPIHFSALVYCGQTAGYIKMLLGTEVVLGPGHIVLDGTLLPAQKGQSLQFSVHVRCDQTAEWNGWMDYDATWYGDRPRPRRHFVRWGPRSHPQKGAQQPRTLRPMSIVAKELDRSSCYLVRR